MAKNVMKLLKPSPNLGKNGFDLSHRRLFDANMGECLPCCCIETVPDDNIEIRVADLLRAMPMVTSPFMRVKQHIDFWFVPYNNLWHSFNAFITSRNEPQSSTQKFQDYVPHFNLRALKQQIFNSSTSVVDVFGDHDSYVRNAYRLLDLLGYPTFNYYYFDNPDPSSTPTDIYDDIDVNAWRLLAYQNIWYHEYRQKMYDNGGLGFNSGSPSSYATYWNVDFCDCSAYATADILSQAGLTGLYSNGWAAAACQMRYRPWKKDLYTGLLPSTQLGAVALANGSSFYTFKANTGYSLSTTDRIGSLVTSTSTTGSNVPIRNTSDVAVGQLSSESRLSILTLRSAQALQIWRENALRAGNQIEDNFEAHYGVRPKSHLNQHPVAIGSIDAPLNISDVTATADTGGILNGSVGDIAGKGISSIDGNKVLRFKTNDFGVVMGIFSLLPETEYNSTGVDRPNQLLERFDYFSPEMENLGLEAVDSGTFTLNVAHQVTGYAPRYYGYKSIPDKAYMLFLNDPTNTFPQGIYRAWASPKYDIAPNAYGSIPLGQLYVRPATFDVNFNVNSVISSQFIVDLFNDVTAVRPMSVTGMPSK